MKNLIIKRRKEFRIGFKFTRFVVDAFCMVAINVGWYKILYYRRLSVPTPKQLYNRVRFELIRSYNINRRNFKVWLKYKLLRSKVYYYWSSTDCDLCTASGYGSTNSIKEYNRVVESMYEDAEGSTSIYIVSKEEWEDYGDHQFRSRDRILEAYENGDGRKVIL